MQEGFKWTRLRCVRIRVRRYYRRAVRANPDGWRKSPKDGGFAPARRRQFYAQWVSKARQEFLAEHPGEIWKRHQEFGFILACDGSEDHLLHFRDGK